MTSDDELVARALDGDQTAFTCLIQRYEEVTFRLVLRLTGNRADAEEVLQDAMLSAFRKLRSFRRQARFSTWLYRIAVNAALMHRRAARVRRAISLEAYLPTFTRGGRHHVIDADYAAAARIESAVSSRERTRLLLDALARLPDRYRVAVVLRDLNELPSREAAAILAIDERTLRQRVHRARLMLRGYLGALMGQEGQ
jgi:RNA polymerase sigma-70 factor (ECF subfamily)